MADVTLIAALQWGDENAEQAASILSEDAEIIITSLKGAKVKDEEGEISLHSLSSAILKNDKMVIVPGGAIANLDAILSDFKVLEKKGIIVDNLFIDERCHIALPGFDAEEQKRKGLGLRAADLLDDGALSSSLSNLLRFHNRLDCLEELLDKCRAWKLTFSNYIIDTVPVVKYAIKEDQKVLVEALDGFMRDISWSSYPYTAYEGCSVQSSLERAAIPPKAVTRTLGVMNAFPKTEVGTPLPTRLKGEDDKQDALGWIDAVALEYACYINGVDEICITGLSALDEIERLKVCTGYQIEGEYYPILPETRKLSLAKPIYAEFEGWKEDTAKIKRWDDLPEKCKLFLDELGTFLNAKISMILTDEGKILGK